MFYNFRQNNSGGNFHYHKQDGISVEVIIEADSLAEANDKAERIGIYFDGVEDGCDCECCGDRWYKSWHDHGTERPEIFGTPVETAKPKYGKWIQNGYEYFVHYKDGNIKGFAD